MNIALIDDDIDYIRVFKDCVITDDIHVDHYLTSLEFRNALLNKYSIIFADYNLSGLSGYRLLKAVSEKTKAKLALIGSSCDKTNKEVVRDKSISYVFNKYKCKEIASWANHVRKRIERDKKFENHIKSLTQVSISLESM